MNNVAIVAGGRSPFTKAGTALAKFSFLDLGIKVVEGVIKKYNIDPALINELIYSTVLLDPRTPNAARELVLRSSLPNSLSAHFISNNCISGLVATNFAVDGIKTGRIKSAIVGGSESMSRPSLTFSYKSEDFFLSLFRAKALKDKLKILTSFKPSFLFPQPPSPKEPSTGLTMGEHCEIMAKEFAVSREEQDKLAYKSHKLATEAQKAGYLSEEIIPIDKINIDNIIREDTSLEKLAKLKPVFDRSEKGTLTAGNSSPLTDGASAVIIMDEKIAKKHSFEILGYIKDIVFAAINPNDGLLMAPALSLPQLLHQNNLTISDIDIFEIHEAFAAQVICNLIAWKNGWNKYPQIKPIGKIPQEKINPCGGSIAIGHPFAATGGRLILSLVNQLKRNNQKRGVISVCAAGAMGCAMLIER